MIKINNIFNTAFLLFYMGLFFSVTAIPYNDVVKKTCVFFSFSLFLIKIIYDFYVARLARKDLIFYFVSILFLLIISVMTHDFLLLMLLTIALASKNITDCDMNVVLIGVIFLTILFSIIIISGCSLGFIQNVDSPRGAGEPSRYAWGFNHSQTLSLICFYLIMYYFVYRKKVKIRELILCYIFEVILAILFDSRNALIGITIFSILIVFCLISVKKFRGRGIKFIFILSSIMPLIMFSFTLFTAYLYDKGSPFVIYLNQLLSNRIRVSSENIKSIPIRLLNTLTYERYSSMLVNTVDNGYLYILLRYGACFVIPVSVIFKKLSIFYLKNNQFIPCCALLTAGISIFVTNSFTGCYFLPFWMMGLTIIMRGLWRSNRLI